MASTHPRPTSPQPNALLKHFKMIFDNAPIAIMERDLTPLLKLKKKLADSGITKFRTHLRTHPKLLTDTYHSLKILHVNQAGLDLFSAKNKKELYLNLAKTYHQETFSTLLNDICCLLEGRRQLASELKFRALDGKVIEVLMRIYVPKAYEKDLKRAIISLEDISLQKKYERHLKRLAQTDGLTHALNNGTIMERLEEEFLRANRYKNDLSIMMIDMDHFKKINDQYGHQKGDLVLRHAASLIKDNLREVDLIGRYGGDEFIAILPETSAQSAKIAGERIRKIFEELSKDTNKSEIISTISIGISGCDSKGVASVKELIRTADRALYFAKTAGRNRVINQ